MEIRNLGDEYYPRLDQSDSHGRSIINQINLPVKTRPVHWGEKYSFTGTGKATGGAQSWGHVFAQHLPVRILARGVTQGSGEMTADAPVIPRNKLVKP